MKKKVMLLTFLAALAFAGCSNDDITNNGGGGTDTEGRGYVSVNIVQPASMTGRAIEADDFQNGSEAENFAEEGLFFLFNQDGTKMYAAQRLVLSATDKTNSIDPAVEKIYNGVLVIDGVSEADDKKKSKQIVCVLNAPAGLETGISTLAQLEAKIDDYCTNHIEKGKFIMTNSVYMAKATADAATSTKVLGATIPEIYGSVAEARKNSVDIYVERAVAKVKIKSVGATFDNKGTGNQMVDGVEDMQYTIKVTGVSIANIANQAYLFKNISGFSSDDTYAWVWDAKNKRSYWETVTLNESNFVNKSYNTIFGEWNQAASDDGTTPAKEFDIKNFTFNDKYILPNTTSNKATDGSALANQETAVLLTAQLLDNTNQPVDLVYLHGGYFTNANALKVIADYVMQMPERYYKGKEKAGSTTGEMEYSSLLPGDFTWTNKYVPDGKTAEERIPWIEDYEAVAKVDENKVITEDGYSIYKKNADGTYTQVTNGIAEIDAKLRGTATAKSPYTAWVWTDGKCYYFVNIDQSSVAADHTDTTVAAHTYDGVVRNHIYDLTLNSVLGLGVPVFDPTIDIIPQIPTPSEKLFYLSATIKVLDWKLVTQTVDFDN